MLAYVLALSVGLGSFALYLAAFFLPEVYRKSDFLWSGVGLFYALVLWVCADRITGSLLLGEAASVALISWLGWQMLLLRRQTAEQPTIVPTGTDLQDALANLAKSNLANQGAFARLPAQLKQQLAKLKPAATQPSDPIADEAPYVPLTRADFASAEPKQPPQLEVAAKDAPGAEPISQLSSASAPVDPPQLALPHPPSSLEEDTAEPELSHPKLHPAPPAALKVAPVSPPTAPDRARKAVDSSGQSRETATSQPAYVRKKYRTDPEATSVPAPIKPTTPKSEQSALPKQPQKQAQSASKPVYVRKRFRTNADSSEPPQTQPSGTSAAGPATSPLTPPAAAPHRESSLESQTEPPDRPVDEVIQAEVVPDTTGSQTSGQPGSNRDLSAASPRHPPLVSMQATIVDPIDPGSGKVEYENPAED